MPSSDLDARALFDLVTSTSAVEWRHKVGVAGRSDGSGKPSTRLLASSGWILKTNLDDRAPSRDAVRARVRDVRERGQAARVWHPSKVWAFMSTTEGWLPLGACRELRTLRTVDSLEGRLAGWLRMIELALDAQARSGIGLDLNPANFAFEVEGGALHYVDDEVYAAFELRHIAFAVAARIPEEPGAYESTWRDWGRAIRERLDARLSGADRDHVVDEILGYPLAEAFEAMRTALVAGVREAKVTVPVRGRRDRVCVLADVHANLPALRAVLAAARDAGARSFLFLGDAVGYGPHPKACVELLAELPSATFIGGNHDHAIATGRFDVGMNRLARACAEWTRASLSPDETAWLGALPSEHLDEGWMAVHGAPRDPHRFLAYVYDLTYEENLAHLRGAGIPLCFHGHTHVPLFHVTMPAGPTKLVGTTVLALDPSRTTLVNPGSVGQPRDGDARASFALWDRDEGTITLQRVTYAIERTLADLARTDLPRELGDRLTRGS